MAASSQFGAKAAAHAHYFGSFFSTTAASASRTQTSSHLGLVGRSIAGSTNGGAGGTSGPSQFKAVWLSSTQATSTAGPTGSSADDEDASPRKSRRAGVQSTSGRRRSVSSAVRTPVVEGRSALPIATLQLRYRSALSRAPSQARPFTTSPPRADVPRRRRHSTSSVEGGRPDPSTLPASLVRPSTPSIPLPPALHDRDPVILARQTALLEKIDDAVRHRNFDTLKLIVGAYLQTCPPAIGEVHEHAIVALGKLQPKGEEPTTLLELYTSMSSFGLRPSPTAHATVIAALSAHVDGIDQAYSIWSTLRKARSSDGLARSAADQLPLFCVNALLKACAGIQDTVKTHTIFNSLRRPSAMSFVHLASTHVTSGDAEAAISVLKSYAEAEKSKSFRIETVEGPHTPQQLLWHHVIAAHVAAGETSTAMALLEHMLGASLAALDGLPPPPPVTGPILSVIVRGLAMEHDTNAVSEWVKRIANDEALSVFAAEVAESAVNVCDSVVTTGRMSQEDADTVRASVAQYLPNSSSRPAEPKPDSVDVIATQLASTSDFETALQLAQKMIKMGARPTGLAALALASAFLSLVGQETASLAPEQWATIVDAFAVSRPDRVGGVIEQAARGGVARASPSSITDWTTSTLSATIESEEEVARLVALLTMVDPPAPRSSDPPDSPEFSTSPSTHASSIAPPSMIELDKELDQAIFAVAPPRALALLQRVGRRADQGKSASAFALADLIRKLAVAAAPIESLHRAYLLGYSALPLTETDVQTRAWLALENEMVKAQANAGSIDKAALHRDRIIQAGLVPSADAIGSMIVHAKDTTDDATVAVELFRDAVAIGVQPNVFLFNTVISRLSRARRAGDALAMFHEMKASGLRPTSVTYGAVINACCKTADEANACALFEEMVASPGYRPNVPPFNCMIQYYQSRGDRDKALSYYDRMVRARVTPTDHTWRLLLDAYGQIEPIDERSALDVFSRIRRDRSVQLSGLHWASLISMYGRTSVDKAVATFDSIADDPSSIRAQPRLPDAIVYEALLNALAANERWSQIDKYRQRMERDGVVMSAYIANTLITAYAAQGQMHAARHVFDSLSDPPAGVAAPTHRQIKMSKRVMGIPQARVTGNDFVYREPSTFEALIRAEMQAGETDRAQALYERAVARAFPLAVLEGLRSLLSPHSLDTAHHHSSSPVAAAS